MRREELLAPIASFCRLSSVVCRLKGVGSRQSAVGREKVASRKSQVTNDIASGNVIGHWSLVIWGRDSTLYTKRKSSNLPNYALRSNIPTSKIQHPKSNIQSVTTQCLPKPFTIHHSSKKALHRNAYRNSSFFIPHSLFAQKERPCLSF